MSWFGQLDQLLKGQITSPQQLHQGRIELSLRSFIAGALFLGAIYGFFMGWYAISLYWGAAPAAGPSRLWQLLSSTVKLPLLFLLTLVVTFPSLYVFSTLMGCRLSFVHTLRLLVAVVTVNVAVAASFGPILGFFTLSTTSYPFMVLLNVILLSIAGFVSLAFLLQALRRLAYEPTPIHTLSPPALSSSQDTSDSAQEPRETLAESLRPNIPPTTLYVPSSTMGHARSVFRIWVLIYAVVGAQMGWILRPFIGSPNAPFEWFRPRSGNFFQAVMKSIEQLVLN